MPRQPLFLFDEQEGTELFKGQNYRQAGARYSKALTHAAKMFDLSSDEQKEVHAVQLSLYLNLAQCYLKLQSWDQVRPGEERSLALGETDGMCEERWSPASI